MTIAYGVSSSPNAWSSAGVGSVAIPYVTGITAGQKLICTVQIKPETLALDDAPAGWTKVGEGTGGTGSFGADTGPVKIAVYERTADGSETGSVTFTGGAQTNSVMGGGMHRFTKTLTNWAPTEVVFGDDAAHAVNWSSTGSSWITQNGDYVLAVAACSGDVVGGTWSSRTITQTSATYGTTGNANNNGTANGNDAHQAGAHVAVTTGGTGAPTFTATTVGAASGVGAFVRLRETNAATVPGTADATLGFTAAAAGRPGRPGQATAALTFTAAAAGVVRHFAAAGAALSLTGTVAGVVRHPGQAAAAVAFTAAVAGRPRRPGQAAASIAFTGAVTGRRRAPGQAAAALAFTATAAGRPGHLGTATAALGFTATAAGRPARHATAAAVLVFTAAGGGLVRVPAAAAAVLEFTAAAAGVGRSRFVRRPSTGLVTRPPGGAVTRPDSGLVTRP